MTLVQATSRVHRGIRPYFATLRTFRVTQPQPFRSQNVAPLSATAVTQKMAPAHITDAILPPYAKAAVFDVDGTLLDSNGCRARSWHKACANHGLTIDKEKYMEVTGKKAKDIVAQLCQEQGKEMSEEEQSAVGHEENDIFQAEGLPKAKLLTEVIDIVDEARRRGLKTAVCSGGQEQIVREVLKRFELEDRFDVVVSSGDVEHAKPDAAIFLKAAERLGLPPSECVAYEDAPLGIQSAEAAGYMAVIDVTKFESHPEHEERHGPKKQ